MHTSAYESCRIHHNGDYWGDIYITNKDSTSKPVREKAEIRYTAEKLVSFFLVKREEKCCSVVLNNIDTDPEDKEIVVLFSDIEMFYQDILIDGIKEKIDQLDEVDDTKKLEQIAELIGLNYLEWI
jgi:hypothetical protein